jgi:hypothetical protein
MLPDLPPTARSARRGGPRRATSAVWFWGYLSISAAPPAEMDPRHGPPFVSRVRPIFVGHPNYALS